MSFRSAPNRPQAGPSSGENLGSTSGSGERVGRTDYVSRRQPERPRKDGSAQARDSNSGIAAGQSRQADNFKRISSWAAILFAPTLVGTIYGMNFDRMPELHWVLGYPFALVLMAIVCTSLYLIFKRRDWL
ncbi:CorA family divalent cation transporter [Streptomyces sp. GESEQ-35]|uniref:CorA family divalent cation transporter n=1 Tax=Streptomyces sp. GESEQ-35 TaxID=2812657 RepID=UPI0024A6F4F7|nr:CorA family divalent cation transporter [Streptomyces sp. GESEQ-35]